MKEKTEIMGTVKNIVFRSEQNGYTVFKLKINDEKIIICTGYFAQINESESINITGNFVIHPVYGEQFKVISIEKKFRLQMRILKNIYHQELLKVLAQKLPNVS